MLRSNKRRILPRRSESDEFMRILIKGERKEIYKIVESLAKRDNPTMLSIMKVEGIFRKNTEFESRSQLLRRLDGSMKASVLNTILARLVYDNKVVVNDDHSLTWIDAKENAKLNKQFNSATFT